MVSNVNNIKVHPTNTISGSTNRSKKDQNKKRERSGRDVDEYKSFDNVLEEKNRGNNKI